MKHSFGNRTLSQPQTERHLKRIYRRHASELVRLAGISHDDVVTTLNHEADETKMGFAGSHEEGDV